MDAIILAAGFGTRLKPITDHIPKALVEIEGKPMLRRIIESLSTRGVDRICVNTHHFSSQVIDFLGTRSWDVEIKISDETEMLLDTGGGVVKAFSVLGCEDPVLVHNVDILSNADIRALYSAHLESGADVTLLVSDRESKRKLIFDPSMTLKGWHNHADNIYRPENIETAAGDKEYAFSGIYVIGAKAIKEMKEIVGKEKFPVMDYLLHPQRKSLVKGYEQPSLQLLDIGKPATLVQASDILSRLEES